jgi:hypothetical protein
VLGPCAAARTPAAPACLNGWVQLHHTISPVHILLHDTLPHVRVLHLLFGCGGLLVVILVVFAVLLTVPVLVLVIIIFVPLHCLHEIDICLALHT